MVLCNFSDIPNINEIDDVNVLDNMEKAIMNLATSIGAQKVEVIS